MNLINWNSKAKKQLRKLDRQVQLATMPACQNVKALANHQHGYRLRVGNYRVLFNWDGAIKVVEIEEVRKRDERTY
jgi:mRNA interferase RelE/StbE